MSFNKFATPKKNVGAFCAPNQSINLQLEELHNNASKDSSKSPSIKPIQRLDDSDELDSTLCIPAVESISSSSEELDDEEEDHEGEFREHVKSMFEIVGVSTTQSYYDVEKKKWLAKQPAQKKRRVTKK